MAITQGMRGPRWTAAHVPEEEVKPSAIDTLKMASSTANKALKVFDKMNESKLKRQGYLESSDYQVQTASGDTINIFERKPGEGRYIKDRFRKPGERIQFSDSFKEHINKTKGMTPEIREQMAQNISNVLKEDGMGLREIGPLMEDIAPGYKVKFIDSPTLSPNPDSFFDMPLDDTLLKEGDLLPNKNFLSGATANSGTYIDGLPTDMMYRNPIAQIPTPNDALFPPGSNLMPETLPSNAFDLGGPVPLGGGNTNPIGGMLRNKFVAQPGVAQGPGMQAFKALKYGTKGAGGPGFFKTLFPGAGGAAGTAAGTTAAGAGAGAAGAGAANTGLMAGMGPLGWTMLAGSLLGKLGLFKKHTLLGKIFSDERLKNNIITVGKSKKGIPIKEFGYNGLEGRYRGVISKDVPWAISKDNASGYDMVDYSKIDVPFERIK